MGDVEGLGVPGGRRECDHRLVPQRPQLRRRSSRRMVAGVASGIGDALQIDPMLVRLAFVVLALASGVGIVIYGVAWVILPDGGGGQPLIARASAASGHDHDVVRGLAFGSIVLGIVLFIRTTGLWFPATLLWPVVLTAAGLAMVWRRPASGQARKPVMQSTAQRGVSGLGDDLRAFLVDDDWSRRTAARLGAGGLLVLLGAATFIATHGSFAALRQGMLAAIVLTLGVALIAAPWLMRLTWDLGEERRERVRTEERARLAAHLHDSVLQTLAIIQKRAHDPRDVVTLARRQERELRAWLYAGTNANGPAVSLAEALAAAADQVEADHAVRVEVVQVGDAPMDDRVATIVAAAREAMVNAAKHAKVDEVSVFAEASAVGDGRVIEVFVRDRGVGFDPSLIAADRHGVTDSICARMEKIDGIAEITSEPDHGTEVRLQLTTPVSARSVP